jgi:hypothetical protein
MRKHRGSFPAMMRHKVKQQSKTTKNVSWKIPLVAHLYPTPSSNPNMDSWDASKNDLDNEDSHPPQTHFMEKTAANQMLEYINPTHGILGASRARNPPTTTRLFAPLVLSSPRLALSHRHLLPPPNYSGFQHRTDISICIGDPSLQIHRLTLPLSLLPLLDCIVAGCEEFAANREQRWLTDLYSLTKQDVALRDIPRVYQWSEPIVSYICYCIEQLWGCSGLTLDKNQPHVLKYDVNHTGVELHHDKCDVTANLCLSRPTEYIGGG